MPRTGAARHRKLYPRTTFAMYGGGSIIYADKLGISLQHLSTTVRQVTGRNVLDIIAHVVIVDVKAKLKSTNMTIQEIAYSLNFPSASFFGKYFKRHMGMSPLEYRNS